jgi:hypothetical protein
MEFQEVLVKSYVDSIRPKDPEIRKDLDYGYSYNERAIEIFEIRPQYNNHKVIHHYPFAKIRRIKSQNIWKLYWMRASGKWELYDPYPQDTSFEKLIDIIRKDAHACFFG